jgi:hypothetical protein
MFDVNYVVGTVDPVNDGPVMSATEREARLLNVVSSQRELVAQVYLDNAFYFDSSAAGKNFSC